MNNAYSSIAKFYNRLADRDCDRYYDYVKALIGGSVVELGAGAGRFTRLYIGGVSSAVLVDSSPEMLGELNANLIRYRRKTDVVLASAESFEPIKKADAVLAVSDVFNYVRDLDALVKRIAGYHNAGGYLIFDVSTEYKLFNVIGDNVFYEDYDDLTYLWTNKREGSSIEMDITVFERDGDIYRRSDERGVQYAHSLSDIERALCAAGYSFTAADADDFGAVRDDSLHVLFTARRL